jgi:hypothetical protein
MARCEDFPCCGHEAGCCPDFDEETGEQLNMVCTCGAKLPMTSRYSICQGCLNTPEDGEPYDSDRDYDDDEEDSDDEAAFVEDEY